MVDTTQVQSLYAGQLKSLSFLVAWIFMSAIVILFNKWILAYFEFSLPISLTLWHMVFATMLSTIIVKGGFVKAPERMTPALYGRAVVPIGACFATQLWLGNASYMYLSVTLIQIMKSLGPILVFFVGCVMGVQKLSLRTLAILLAISGGVAVASYGETDVSYQGMALQATSILCDAIRMTLIQLLLQRQGIVLNPITSIYYVAPCCGAFLLVPWVFIELPKLLESQSAFELARVLVFVVNAILAYLLNITVFLLVGSTSALTASVGGAIKDWMVILSSIVLFNSTITPLTLVGYTWAFAGACYYNYCSLIQDPGKENPSPVKQRV